MKEDDIVIVGHTVVDDARLDGRHWVQWCDFPINLHTAVVRIRAMDEYFNSKQRDRAHKYIKGLATSSAS